MQAPPPEPPQVIEVAPVQAVADFVVLSRSTRSDVVAGADTPLVLVKARRTEDALLRQAVFVTATVTLVRPAAQPGPDSYRWTYEGFLQRQLCFTSMSGVFACNVAEVTGLPDHVTGEALAPAPQPGGDGTVVVPEAEAARMELARSLRARAEALFEADRRAKVDPVFRAAGVAARRAMRSRPAKF